jgi:hypothetical protein
MARVRDAVEYHFVRPPVKSPFSAPVKAELMRKVMRCPRDRLYGRTKKRDGGVDIGRSSVALEMALLACAVTLLPSEQTRKALVHTNPERFLY